jgi:ElaB/YqjD/DUF883 family membrane-anchored ribosome-binding protein
MVALKEKTMDKATEKAIEKASEAIDALAERAKDALASFARSAGDIDPGELREGAWRMAERAREQAAGFAGDLYTRGQRSARVVRGQVEEQPWVAIAVVGALALLVGYALRSGNR